MDEKQILFQIKEEAENDLPREKSCEAKQIEEATKSLWNATLNHEKLSQESSDALPEQAEVVVIGGGMAGILTAYELTKRGMDTIVLECKEIGQGSTAYTTAKITSLHGGIYSKLVSSFGKKKARQYYESQEAAIREFESIVKENHIECGFETTSHILYTQDEREKLEKEYECMKELGISADYVTSSPLPFAIQGGIVFKNQAKFHPLEFLYKLSKQLKVYTKCKVTRIDSDGTVWVDHKKAIRANHLVVATHYPIINSKGFFYTKLDQERSYVIALEQKDDFDIHDMYIDLNEKGHSFRRYQNYLLMGVGNHRSGKKQVENYYKVLEGEAASWFPKAKIVSHWSNQDCMSIDSIPYIGRYSKSLKNVYVATGFGQWGMTNSMVSAKVIADLITTGSSEYEELYSPSRYLVSGTGSLLENAGVSIFNLSKQFLHASEKDIKQIGKLQAGIIKYESHSVGVYRDEENQLHLVDTKCPHLGCQLQWNPNDKTWDCPCHGSRFDIDGHWIETPAQRNLSGCCTLHKSSKS